MTRDQARKELLTPLTDEEARDLNLVTGAEIEAALRAVDREMRPLRWRRWPCF